MTAFNPPFRAEHVGSLLRPRTLKAAAKARRAGSISEEAYLETLEQEIARVVHLQESVGLRSITDGEFGRTSWFGFFFDRLKGLALKPSLFRFHDEHGHNYEWQTCYASERMRRVKPICTDEFERLARLASQTPKANMPSPSAFHFFRGDRCRDEQAYPDIEEWWSDLVSIYQAEIRDLYNSGCRYLQLDEVPLAILCDSSVRQQVAEQGHDPDQLTRRYISTINTVLQASPTDMTVGLHLCRGNFRSRWMAQGGYEPVAEQLFHGLDVDAFFLEYDSTRAGDFSPLRLMAPDKRVVLGIMTSKSAELEDKATLIGRIEEASKHVPLDSLAVSPQCGFASVAGGNELTEEEQMRKLALVVEIAEEVWGQA